MALRSVTFEVQLESAGKALAFDFRAATADWLRDRIKRKIDTAEDAGIDKATAIQKFCLSYVAAAKASRLCRGVPVALVRWGAYVEHNAAQGWFPAAPRRAVGTFSKDALVKLPHDICLIRLGGIDFIGVWAGEKPDDLIEIRVGYNEDEPGKFVATLISGRPDDGQSLETPEPAEPELQDA